MNSHIDNLVTIDRFSLLFDRFLELHGDRKSGDDNAVVGGLARLNKRKAVAVSFQADKSAPSPVLPAPEGYRKAMRLARLAEAFHKPIIIFIDALTVPLLSTLDQQRLDASMAQGHKEMSGLEIPIVGVMSGEFEGTRATDMCVMDSVIMMEDAGCSIPLTREGSDGRTQTGFVRFKAMDLLNLNVINRIVKSTSEVNQESAADALREAIRDELTRLEEIKPQILVEQRLERLQHQFRKFSTSDFQPRTADKTIED